MPAWLVALLGAEGVRVQARTLATTVRLRVVEADGRVRAFALQPQVRAAPRCHELDRSGHARPVPGFEQLHATHRAALERFFPRLRWLEAVRAAGTAPGSYAPSPREAGWAALRPAILALSRQDAVPGAAPAVPGREPAAPPSRAGAPAAPPDELLEGWPWYAAVAEGRLEELLALTDAERLPLWARTVVLGLRGRQEALAALARVPPGAPSALEVLRAFALEEMGARGAAREVLRAALEAVPFPERAHLYLVLAELERELGDERAALEAVRRAAPVLVGDGRATLRVVERLRQLGAFEDAAAVLRAATERDPDSASCLLGLAQHHLWARQLPEAHALHARLRSLPEARFEAARLEGALATLEGRLGPARQALDEALGLRPRDAEAHTWMAEVCLREGELPAARAHLTLARNVHETAVHTLLDELVEYRGPSPAAPLLGQLCRVLGVEEPLPAPPLDHAEALRWLDRLLAPFGDNRTALLTRVEAVEAAPGAPAEPRLVRFVVPSDDEVLAARRASSDALKRLRHEGVGEVLAAFEALLARYPGSPHPRCYRGELYLWLGRYAEAFADFDAALGIAETRWAFVGKAAVCILEGRFAEARRHIARCNAQYRPVPSATTPVYVGEMLRREGDHAEACRHLEEATAAKPGRMGAWLNLALARAALGQPEAAAAALERVTRHVPCLLWDARAELAAPPPWPLTIETMAPTLEHALTMLRGNRSSHLITYFDRDARLYLAQDADAWSRRCRQASVYLRVEVDQRLGRFA